MAARYLMHFALLVTTFGTKDEAAACAPGPGRGGQEVLDANSFLQLVTESGAALTASGAEEASAGAKPVEEIAGGELDVMTKALDVVDNALGKEMGVVDNALGKEMGVVDKALDVVDKGMEHIVGMKTTELGVVERKQGLDPAGPQEVEGLGPDDDDELLTSGAQEETRGATTNGTQVVANILDQRVLGDRSSADPWHALPGQDDQSSVVGDPHVVNVAHARFEIRAEGLHKLVQIPQFMQANSKPDLRVDAKIQHLVSNDCSKSFMTSLSIFGRWTEDAFGLMRISQGSDMPNTTLLINTLSPEEFFTQFPLPGVKAGHASVAFKLRDVSFHVGKHFEGRYGNQKAYLNVRITGLKKHNDLGGLLGYDDHADAEKLDVNCAAAKPAAVYQNSFIGMGRSAPIITDGGSRIEAE